MGTKKSMVDNLNIALVGSGEGREEILNGKEKIEEANVGEDLKHLKWVVQWKSLPPPVK